MNPNDISIHTHEPLRAELPIEESTLGHDRPDVPAPHLWSPGVVVVHARSKRSAVVHRVDLNTRQFRAYYPDTKTFDTPTGWQSFDGWDVEVTLSPKELERQAAARAFEVECQSIDAKDLARILVFCDDPDPAKRLEKLNALRDIGAIKAKPEAAKPEVTTTTTTNAKDVKR